MISGEQQSERSILMTKEQLLTKTAYHWNLWTADNEALGALFAHSQLEPTDSILVYEAPETLDVQVRDDHGAILASGDDLARSFASPITRLRIRDKKIVREEIWPGEVPAGSYVLLPDGETGHLKTWSTDDDYQEWHMDVEFSYHR
jgi:hypothetical protein